MNLKVGILDVQRDSEAFTLNGIRQRGGDVEVQRVAEFIGLGRSAGFNAGCQVASIMTSKTRLAKGSQKVAQRLEAKEVQTLVGDLEARLLCLARLSTDARLARRIVRLVDG